MEQSNADTSIIKIFLDSENILGIAENGAYIFDISKDITSTASENIMIELTEASIPHSFYPIDSSNNTFNIGEQVFSISGGNYTASELCKKIENDPSSEITCTFNENNNKISMTNIETTAVELSKHDTSNLLTLLGFGDSDTNLPTGTEVIAPNSVNLAGPDALYFRITNEHIKIPNIDPSGNYDNVLAKIPITGGFNEYTFYTNNKHSPITLEPKSTIPRTLEIKLEDKTGKNIDFNGLSWSATITIYFSINTDTSFYYNSIQF